MSSNGSVSIEMPAMGESVTEGTVLEWHVAEGDTVSEGDTIVEVSTDKVDAEVPAPQSGTITKILVGEDEDVKVGEALAELEPGDGDGAAASSASGSATAEEGGSSSNGGGSTMVAETGEGDADLGGGADAPAAERGEVDGDTGDAEGAEVTVEMPEMGESVTEGTVLEYHVAVGDEVAEGDTIVEVSTDKVDAEVPAPASGTITEVLKSEDDVVKVGEALAKMTSGSAEGAPAGNGAGATATEAPPAGTAGGIDTSGRATPLARRIAADKGIDLGFPEGQRRGRQGDQGGRPERRRQRRRSGSRRRGRSEAAQRPRRGARQRDEREPLDPDGDLLPDASRRHDLGEAQGDQRGARRARDEGLLHAPDRLGDRRGREAVARDVTLVPRAGRQAARASRTSPSTSASPSTSSARTAHAR